MAKMASGTGAAEIDHRIIRDQVTRIEDSETFGRARDERHLLRFLVEKTLAGHEDKLLGRLIAVELFQRDHVKTRQTVMKLRTKLFQYYDSEGSGDLLKIQVPNRTFVPKFKLEPSSPA